MKGKSTFRVIGLMSGTSLDGLDIACCRFVKGTRWKFEMEESLTVRYSSAWKRKLSGAHLLSAEDLQALDAEYGSYQGRCCREFVQQKNLRDIDLIASHGHTIFHQPGRRFTLQIGNGNALHAASGLPVAYDFRSLDVALGGQGAPLVPIGDRLLFREYDVCLNLGGIANLSLEKDRRRKACDLAYVNLGLNYLAQKRHLELDRDGKIAMKGKLDHSLLDKLERIYRPLRKSRPSLGREGFEQWIVPLLDDESISLEDKMYTFCFAVANEIRVSLPRGKKKLRMLMTGGGTWNRVLVRLISEATKDQALIVIPARQVVDFKEALIFAFLGVLRLRGEVNVLKSVTHAKQDSCAGTLVGIPKSKVK